jgi:hypothetical protein
MRTPTMRVFHEILTATLALTIAAYTSAAALTAQPSPINPDRSQVITSLTETGNNGSRAIFGLLTLNLLKLAIGNRKQS